MKHILFLLICCVEFPKVSIIVGTSFDLYFFIKMYFILIFSYFLLQLKYKRRVYKMLHMDEKQLKAINSKASKKKFNDHVLNNNVDKVNKMCAKGLDPNFHCQDSHTGGKAHYLSVSLLCNFWSDGLCSF